MEWYRVYHGMPEDAKLQVIAKRTSQPMAHVVSVWVCLLDAASKHDPRGEIQIDPEQIAVVQDIELDAVESIIEAFYDKGMIGGDNRLTAWNKRQYATATERSRVSRAKNKTDATPRNTMQRQSTSSNAREQKNSKKQPDTDNRLQNTDSDSRTDAEPEKEKNTDKKTEREEKEECEKEKHKTAEQMLQIWNAEVQQKLTPDHKAILTPQRKDLLCKRWQEDFQKDLRAWQYYCEVISSSEFCLGKIDGKGWTIDLSWAIKSSEHVAKILEGGFSGGKHPAKPPACNVPQLQPAWDYVLNFLQQKHGKPTIRCWFAGAALSKLTKTDAGAVVTIECQRKFVRDWIAEKFQPDINRAFKEQRLFKSPLILTELTIKEKL
jgi:hypothetical protein